MGMSEPSHAVTAITHDLEFAGITVHRKQTGVDPIPGVLAELAHNSVSFDLIGEFDAKDDGLRVSFTVRRNEVGAVSRVIEELIPGARVRLDTGLAKILIDGTGLLSDSTFVPRMLSLLASSRISVQKILTSQIRISVLTYEESVARTVNLLQHHFSRRVEMEGRKIAHML